jgi:hypothetical protein
MANYAHGISYTEPAEATAANEEKFRKELEELINKYSMENGSDTPDFLLANYLTQSLNTYNNIVVDRENWYGRSRGPAFGDPEPKLNWEARDLVKDGSSTTTPETDFRSTDTPAKG